MKTTERNALLQTLQARFDKHPGRHQGITWADVQTLGTFDAKTSSWIATPPDVRALGGALFGDWRYGRVFIYPNGVQSYYAARGFRGVLRV